MANVIMYGLHGEQAGATIGGRSKLHDANGPAHERGRTGAASGAPTDASAVLRGMRGVRILRNIRTENRAYLAQRR
ncbi:MAG: hypothetical protein ACM3ZQ_02325, partial [Bacillota bacterium]